MRSWKSDRSAKIVGSCCPGGGASGGAPASPPMRATVATPVRPWSSSFARVSVRIGVVRSTSISATTRLVSSRSSFVTSPLRMPLKVTIEPFDSPETEPENTTRTGCRRAPVSPPENQ